jgi:hypothetical protein
MGAEATCTVRFNGKSGTGKARLETGVLRFRGGDVRLAIPFGQISKISARAGTLRVTLSDGSASLNLPTLKTMMKPNGALWIRLKGRPEISETAVMAAGSAAGLVDVKVVRLSPIHTSEKFVIPLSKRGPAHE